MREMADQFTGANAVHIRHLNIHQNEIQLRLFGLLYGILAAIAQNDMLHQIVQQRANKLEVGRVIIYRHYRHRQFITIDIGLWHRRLRAARGHQHREKPRGGQWFKQAGGNTVSFQLFGANLRVARQPQHQGIGK